MLLETHASKTETQIYTKGNIQRNFHFKSYIIFIRISLGKLRKEKSTLLESYKQNIYFHEKDLREIFLAGVAWKTLSYLICINEITVS